MNTAERDAAWEQWLCELPEAVATIARRFQPWEVYRMKSTGHGCSIYSIEENQDGSITMRVNITQDLNPDRSLVFDRRVFGIQPDDLEPVPLSTEGWFGLKGESV